MKRKYTRRNVSKNRNNKKRTYKNRNNKKRTYKNRNNKKRTYKKRSYRRKGYKTYKKSKYYNKKQLGGDDSDYLIPVYGNLNVMYPAATNTDKAKSWRKHVHILKHYGKKWGNLRISTYKELYSVVKKEYNDTEVSVYAHIDWNYPEEREDYGPIACKEIHNVVGTEEVYEFEAPNGINYRIKCVDRGYMNSVWPQLITGTEGFGGVELVVGGKYLIQERMGEQKRYRFVVKKKPWTGLTKVTNSFLNSKIEFFDTVGANLVLTAFNRYRVYLKTCIDLHFTALYNIAQSWWKSGPKAQAYDYLLKIGIFLNRRGGPPITSLEDILSGDSFNFTFNNLSEQRDISLNTSLAIDIKTTPDINYILEKLHNIGILKGDLFTGGNIELYAELFHLYSNSDDLTRSRLGKLGIFSSENIGKLNAHKSEADLEKMGGTKINHESNIMNGIVAEAFEYLPEGEIRVNKQGRRLNMINSGNTTGEMVGGAMTRDKFLEMYNFATEFPETANPDESQTKMNDMIDSSGLPSWTTDLYKVDEEIPSLTGDPLSGVTQLFRELIQDNIHKYQIQTDTGQVTEGQDTGDQVTEDLGPPENLVPDIYHTGEFVYELQVKKDDKIILLGDIHGSVQTLWRQINKFIQLKYITWPKESATPKINEGYYIVFLGDICDRGAWSLESYLLIGLLIKNNPKQCILNRGNHETEEIFSRDGFKDELYHRLGIMIPKNIKGTKKKLLDGLINMQIQLFKTFFSTCPSAVLVKYPETQHVWCCHGGVPMWFKDEYMVSCRLFSYKFVEREKNIAKVLMYACKASIQRYWGLLRSPNQTVSDALDKEFNKYQDEYKKLTGITLRAGLERMDSVVKKNPVLSVYGINTETTESKFANLDKYFTWGKTLPLNEMRWNDVGLDNHWDERLIIDYGTGRQMIPTSIICNKLKQLGCCFMVRGHQDHLANHVLHPTHNNAIRLPELLEPEWTTEERRLWEAWAGSFSDPLRRGTPEERGLWEAWAGKGVAAEGVAAEAPANRQRAHQEGISMENRLPAALAVYHQQSVTTEAGAIVEIKIKNDSDIEYINSRGIDISERVFLSRAGPRNPLERAGDLEKKLPVITISTNTGYVRELPRDSHLILRCEAISPVGRD